MSAANSPPHPQLLIIPFIFLRESRDIISETVRTGKHLSRADTFVRAVLIINHADTTKKVLSP
jgi:hypothetical protein